ncbi:MAG TPA: tetratricopeptide repeat protein [Thermoanaerobaculia bacterium]
MRNTRPRAAELAAAGLLLVVAACSYRSTTMDADEVATELRQRGLDPNAVVYPHGITDEMRAWAHQAVDGAKSELERLTRLQASLLDPGQLPVRYQWGYTGTAVEVFEYRQANCLAFTNLFVGMARELGVEVYYLGVNDIESYRREGDLVVVSDHIAVGYGTLSDRTIFDFSQTPPDDYHDFSRISDLTAIAMFHSNRGAEALQAGLVEASVRWLETAVRIDPQLANAWVNLGVALRRQGDHGAAEQAYRKAVEIDPRTYSAYQNLASLLRLLRRLEEARAYEQILASSPNRNPFTYLTLGDVSLLGGRLDEAEKLYRRAVRRKPDDADAYAALGHLAASSGNLRTARRMLRRAQKFEDAGEHPRVRRLEEILARHDGGR